MQEIMNRPEASNEFGPRDWAGDRGTIGHHPNVCLTCGSQFWGHEQRMLCKKCNDDMRTTATDDIVPSVYVGDKLRRVLMWMIPAGIVMWVIIYAAVRSWLSR